METPMSAVVDGLTQHAIRATPSDVQRRVIFASSLGTMFEWYDFFLAGSLAAEISKSIFSGVNPTAAFIFTLLSFAAGFAVRPFGALGGRPYVLHRHNIARTDRFHE
jgi:hypothetical protein